MGVFNVQRCKNADYVRHMNTVKHRQRTAIITEPELPSFIRDIMISNHNSHQLMKEIVMSNRAIVVSNHELQLQVVELSNKQPIQQITNNIVQQNTQNNTSFNIQVFLDEKCGDAMNLSAFLKTLAITNEDLVRNTEIGFVAGMS